MAAEGTASVITEPREAEWSVPQTPLGSRVRERVRRQPLRFCVLALALLTIFLYGGTVPHLGFYYDDWAFFSAMQDAHTHWWPDLFQACRTVDSAGRPGGCVYHSFVFMVLGDHIKAYHLMSIAYLITGSSLLLVLMRRCGMPWKWALAVACAYVVYPGSDATRLWPTSSGAQSLFIEYIVGVLLAIAALKRTGRRAAALHVASFAIYFWLAFTYEALMPLIAVAGGFYLLACGPRRRVIVRGAVDLVFALAFTFYRLVLVTVPEGSGFVVKRTPEQDIVRGRALLHGLWNSWQQLYVPTGFARLVLVVCAVFVIATAVARPATRGPLGRWLLVALGGAAFSVAAIAAFLPANDLYVPVIQGTFNRLNVFAAPAFAVVFVALLALFAVALHAWLSARTSAEVVLVAAMLIAASQVNFERDQQRYWAASWKEQVKALNMIKRIQHHIPRNASIITFGHPIWEPGYIPIFSSSWDVRGAIDAQTSIDPPVAMPFVPGTACGPAGVTYDGGAFADYRAPDGSPLWFINTVTYAHFPVPNKARCDAAVAEFGAPPYVDPDPF